MSGNSRDYCIAVVKPEHLPGIAEIEKQSFSLPWTPAQLEVQACAENNIFLFAKNEKNDILGYIGCQTVLDEGYITNVAVSLSQRRKGVADALIAALVERAKTERLRFLTLEVRESNTPAVALYEKHGFLRVGSRPGYYEKPRETAVLMTLFL